MKRLVRLCPAALSIATSSLFLGGLATVTANAEPYVYQGGRAERSPGNLFVGEGEESHELPIHGTAPSLAPDGKRIIFHDDEGEKTGTAITDLDGHGPHLILPSTVELYNNFEWAPDGSEVLTSTLKGNIVSLRPSPTSMEWVVETILEWEGKAFEPTVSPDGSKIAFMSHYDATGKALGNPAIFIANRNGSGVEQLTSPPAYAADGPSFSPDGKEIVFDGLAEKAEDTDIFSINVKTKTVTDLTNTPSFEESGADYLSNGRIAYSNGVTGFSVMDANGEHKESIKTFGEEETWYQVSWPQIQGDLPSLGPETKEEATKLLLRYAPKMRYDSMEPFFAMNWHPITEIFFKKSTKESNRLIRSEAEKSAVIAYANPALSSPNLNWEFLKPSGGKYPNGKLVNGGDRLSERTNNEEGALGDIEADEFNPVYKDRTYGRVKYDGGRWWLQYWLWYYYQPFLEGFGDHEGDWEMVQIGLNEDGLPELATYAEHSGGESCTFEKLPTSIGYYGNLAPDVFVSYGVHASYTNTEHLGLGEVTDGAVPIDPQVENMYDTENWVQWPGKWGDSETSPGTPSTQGNKWSAPAKFYEEGGECTSSGLRPNRLTQKGQASPLPELSATRAGNVVTVSYQMPENAQPRPKWILVKVSESGGIPVGGNYPVHGNSGQVQIEVPFEGDRLVAMARTLDLEGHSEVAEIPVR